MKKVLLLVLDGWGMRKSNYKNAIKTAKTPNLDKLQFSTLKASGSAVGLPPGYMGNSEVGHLTIGAGRIIPSDLKKINQSIKNKSFYKNKALLEAIKHVKKYKTKLHLMGLISDAGVHSHINHLFALLKLAKQHQVKEVYIHAFLDGRDTPPKAAAKYIKQIQKKGTIATMIGRFYAMDRDNRWKREHKAYDAMVNCVGKKENNALQALKKAYQRGETDEFIKPIILTNKCVVEKNDSVIFFNFRSDRARELTRSFIQGKFKGFKRKKIIDLKFVTLTQYDQLIKTDVAFPPHVPKNTLGEIIAKAGLKQLRIAETEKWAHVTYFFNGLCECIFANERRIHIFSDKLVKTYDQKPGMKIKQITEALLKNISDNDFFVVNFANGDMVGHTGNFKAAVKAAEAVDKEVGKIIKSFPGEILITADHGNLEDMSDDCKTCHTMEEVPFIYVGKKTKSGQLSDIAPTVLKLLKIKKPKEMTGKSLF